MKVAIHPNAELEAQIDEAHAQFLAAEDETERRGHWKQMLALIGKRSPMRVKRMEREKGLDKRATFVPREQMRKETT